VALSRNLRLEILLIDHIPFRRSRRAQDRRKTSQIATRSGKGVIPVLSGFLPGVREQPGTADNLSDRKGNPEARANVSVDRSAASPHPAEGPPAGWPAGQHQPLYKGGGAQWTITLEVLRAEF
jgi:hypothetical protein